MAINFTPTKKENENEKKDDSSNKSISFTPKEEKESKIDFSEVEEEPSTTASGLAGSVVRGVVPTIAESTAGAILGMPLGFPGVALGAAAGPSVGAVSEMAGGKSLVNSIAELTTESVNKFLGTHYSVPEDAVTAALDAVGVPKPRTYAERMTEAVSRGVTEMATGAGALKGLSKAVSAGKLKDFAEAMGTSPVGQAAIGGSVSGAVQQTEEMGGGPLAQLGVGLGAGLIGVPAVSAVGGTLGKLVPAIRRAGQAAKAEELAAGVLRESTIGKEKAIQALAEAPSVTEAGIKPMTGDITADPKMIQLQNKLRSISDEMMTRDIENVAGISQKLEKGMEQAGATPEQAQAYFKAELDDITNQAEQAKSSLIASGDAESARILDEASIFANEQKQLAEQGIQTSKESLENATEALKQKFQSVKDKVDANQRDQASELVTNVISNQRSRQKDIINQAYDAAKIETPPFQQNETAKSIEQIVKNKEVSSVGGIESIQDQIKLNPNIPSHIKSLYKSIVDNEGNFYSRELGDLTANIKEINAAIRKEPNENNRRLLLIVKDGLNKDIEKLGDVNEAVKNANKLYAQYADVYKKGASKKVFDEKVEPSKSLYEYLKPSQKQLGKEEIQRLKKAIDVNPEFYNKLTPEQRILADADRETAREAINKWVYGTMADAMKESNTSQSIKNWVTNVGQRISKEFPDEFDKDKGQIIKSINDFQNLEKAKNEAKIFVEKSKKEAQKLGKSASDAESEANERIRLIEKSYKKLAGELSDNLQKSIDPSKNPAAAFVGGNPQQVIKRIMSGPNVQENISNLVEKAKQDPSGEAIEGLRNAFKGWLNTTARTGETVGTGIPKEVASPEDYAANLDVLRNLIIKGSPTRNALETVFGKESSDLRVLDEVRRQLEMIERRGRASIAEPAKLEKAGQAKESPVKDTLLEIAAITAGGVRGFVAFKGVDLLRKIQKTYGQETLEIMRKMLTDAMLDPEIARTMMLKPTSENMPKINDLFNMYGMAIRGKAGVEAVQKQETPTEEVEE